MREYECAAPDEVFITLFDNLSPALQRAIPRDGLPCDGDGIKSNACALCPFGHEKYTAEWFDSAYEDEEKLEFGTGNVEGW
jgi:hypothetical protein